MSGDESNPNLEDSEWVDDILARALERARSVEPPSEPTSNPASPLPPTPAPAPRHDADPLPATAVSPPATVATPPTPVAAAHQPLVTATSSVMADTTTQNRLQASVQPPDHTSVVATAEPKPDEIPELDEYVSEPVANRRMRSAIEWTAVIIGALLVAVLIKSFMFQAFYIPSPSMRPTLEVGDRILVNKLSYNLNDLTRGDLIVFQKPENARGDVEDLVKRVIALPGETLEIREGTLYIDSQRLDEPYLFQPQSSVWSGVPPIGCAEPIVANQCKIPEGTVFVMGDNRTNSTDSRVFGPIDQDLIVGRAFLRVYPFTDIGGL